MASFAAACRATARLSSSRRVVAAHSFTSSARCLAAQNFTMPALSPTMTEGNIASWNVKEGDSFSAGDVLLEIETDKATMDVEAQDDGVMFKIMAGNNSKNVKVGTRIGVVAEPGDDLSTLEIPADEQVKQASKPSEEPEAPKESSNSKSEGQGSTIKASSSDKFVHNHPLLPSVGHLVKANGLSDEDLSMIKGTGPQGRLLKGDVLAFIGSIKADIPAAISAHFDKLSHLDLSNIKVAEKKPAPAPKEAAAAPKALVVEDLEINVPVSLAKVVEVQQKIHNTLGVFLPLSTFIARAAEVANDELPPSNRPPTADELFDQVLGLDKIKAAKSSRGIYLPQISAIPPPSALPPSPAPPKTDIIDILAASPKKSRSVPTIATVPGFSSDANVFSLLVPKAEEERALVFLERCKVILEEEPGRLVL